MPEPVTYYSRDGKDYAVFAYDLIELYALSVWIPASDLASKDVWEAIRHLQGRQPRGHVTDPIYDPDEEDSDVDDEPA